jgi:hypothetical protein
MFTTRKLAAGAAALSLGMAGVGLVAVPASAKDGDVIRQGGCSGRADWKIKASPENGRIEVEGEIDSNRRGQTWSWQMRHNGDLTARGSKTTRGRSGSFEVRRVVVNLRGADRLTFRATYRGQVCSGSMRF